MSGADRHLLRRYWLRYAAIANQAVVEFNGGDLQALLAYRQAAFIASLFAVPQDLA